MAAPTPTVTAIGGLTTSIVVGGGDNYMLVGFQLGEDQVGAIPTVVTAVYGAQSMSLYASVSYATTGRTARVEVWKLSAPTVGTANLVVVLSDASSVLLGIAHVLAGASLSGPNAFTTDSAAANNISTSVTSVTNDSLLISFGAEHPNGPTFTCDSPGVQVQNTTKVSGNIDVRGVSATYALATAGAQALGWTVATGYPSRWAHVVVAVPPLGGGGGGGGTAVGYYRRRLLQGRHHHDEYSGGGAAPAGGGGGGGGGAIDLSTMGAHPRLITSTDVTRVRLQRTNNTSRWQNVKAVADAQVALGSGYSSGDEFALPCMGLVYQATVVADPTYAATIGTRMGVVMDGFAIEANNLQSSGDAFYYRYQLMLVGYGLDWGFAGVTTTQQHNAAKWLMNRADWLWVESNASRSGGWALNNPGSNYYTGFTHTGLAALVAYGSDTGTTSTTPGSGSDRPSFHANLVYTTKWGSEVTTFLARGQGVTGGNAGGAGGLGGSLKEGTYYDQAWALARLISGYTNAGFSLTNVWFDNAAKWKLHSTLPGFAYKLNFGDQARESTGSIYIYDREAINALMPVVTDSTLRSQLQYLLGQIGQVPTTEPTETASLAQELLWYDPARSAASDLSALPLGFTAIGAGVQVVRQSWTDQTKDLVWFASQDIDEGHMGKCCNAMEWWSKNEPLLTNADYYSASGIEQDTVCFSTMSIASQQQRIGYGNGYSHGVYTATPTFTSTLCTWRSQGAPCFWRMDPPFTVEQAVTNFLRQMVYLPDLDVCLVVDAMTAASTSDQKIVYWQAKNAVTVAGQTFRIDNDANTNHIYGVVLLPSSGVTVSAQTHSLGSGGATSSHYARVYPATGNAADLIVTSLQRSTAGSAPHTISVVNSGGNATFTIDSTITVTVPLDGTTTITRV